MTASVFPRAGLILATALCLVVIGVTPVMAEWSTDTVGSMYFWNSSIPLVNAPISLAVDSHGNSHISYLDTNQQLAYARWDGKKWVTTVVDDTTKAGASSLAIGSGDFSGISYYDASKHALKYAKSNGAIWETIDGEGGEAGSYNALALDSSNYPWISEYDAGSQRLKSGHWTGRAWQIDAVEGGTAGQYNCIALTSKGYPVIGLYDEHAGNGRLKYVYWDGTQWNVDHVVEEGQVGKYASCAVDKNDVIQFSYYDEKNKALKYARGKVGEAFTTSIVDNGNVGLYTSIAIDKDNIPHISYWDEGHDAVKYTVAKPDSTDWSTYNTWTKMAIPGSSGAWFGEASSLAIGPDNIPRIAFMEHTSSGTRLRHGKFYPTTANFTFSPTSGPAPLSVTFTDTTTNGTHNSWLWDFGDGTLSTNQNPTHTFTSEGTYKVKLTVSNSLETLSTTRVKTVKVLAPSNVRVFGDPYQITLMPTHADYQSLGGASAIRRDGSLETFVGGINLSGHDWVQVTRGAAIKKDGNLVTWTDGVIPKETYAAAARSSTSSTSRKKYVQISQYNDWLLAIYEDTAGVTHLETRGNSADHPEVFANVPSGTGWLMVAAGRNHALALRSDGTLVAWGNNTYGQLDLPADAVYTDIAAGDDFSIGLTKESSGTGGYVRAAGKNDESQVTDVPKTQEAYIQVAAGQAAGAALGPHGQIILWGKRFPGIEPSSAETDFTDISLGPTWGLAIKEPAREIHLTGPLSPGQSIPNSDGVDDVLPLGATLEHTENDVTRIFAPNGTLIGWVNDEEAPKIRLPGGRINPSTRIHVIPDRSVEDVQGNAITVTSYDAPNTIILKVLDNNQEIKIIDQSLAKHQSSNDYDWANAYIEGFDYKITQNIGTYSTKWTVPKSPVTSSSVTKVHIWNGVQNTSVKSTLIQPVLTWNDDLVSSSAKWTGRAYIVSDTTLTGDRVSVSQGDSVEGIMTWDKDLQKWKVQFHDITAGTYSTQWSNAVDKTNVAIENMLEGIGVTNHQHLPGDITFTDNSVKSPGGSSITPSSMTCKVSSTWSGQSAFTGNFSTDCSSWPSSIKLKTDQN